MFKLYTDASDIRLGAVLMQEDDQGKDRVICYEAKTLLPAEKNYPTTEKECLAVMWAMQKFKHFLEGGQPFEVYTDHAVLKTLMTHENPSPRRARWIEKMAPFNFTIHYRPGVKMGHADFASRMDTFLPKDSITESISTLRAQKQPEFLITKSKNLIQWHLPGKLRLLGGKRLITGITVNSAASIIKSTDIDAPHLN